MDTSLFLAQLDTILKQFRELQERSQHARSDMSDVPNSDLQRVITLARAAIDRIAGRDSSYAEQADDILHRKGDWDGERLINIVGIVESLKLDVESGHLQSVAELIHGDVFSDFLEMAAYLSQEKYKDAAAVIAGSTLEAHLRQICQKNSIDANAMTGAGTRPKKAELMNSELATANAYSKLDQKNVTAWLDLRNKAAHGHYAEYTTEQVALAIDGIRNFIARVPA